MKITIGEREVSLKDDEVVIARRLVNGFLSTIKSKAEKAKQPSLYFTVVIMMYKKSLDLLYETSPEALQILMDLLTQDVDPEEVKALQE